MGSIVYITCAILSFSCAVLLLSGFKKNRFSLLFWSSIGFFGFALNNALLFIDIIMIPTFDLSVIRTLPALIGMVIMVYGLISDSV